MTALNCCVWFLSGFMVCWLLRAFVGCLVRRRNRRQALLRLQRYVSESSREGSRAFLGRRSTRNRSHEGG